MGTFTAVQRCIRHFRGICLLPMLYTRNTATIASYWISLVGARVQFCEADKLILFTALYHCFVYFVLEVDLFIPLSVYLCCWKGQSWVKISLFSFGAETGFALSGLKAYNSGTYSSNLCCFVFLLMCVFISCFVICTVLPLLYLRVKFYSCFFVQYFFVLYLSLCVSFARTLNGFESVFVVLI